MIIRHRQALSIFILVGISTSEEPGWHKKTVVPVSWDRITCAVHYFGIMRTLPVVKAML